MFFKGPFWGAYIWRGSSMEGNLRFKIDWASLIVGRKFTIFALFYFVFEGNFQVPAPGRSLYLKGWFNGGCFALRVWGAYIWKAYFRNFTVCWFYSSWMFDLYKCVYINAHYILKKCSVVLLGRCRACIESTFFHPFQLYEPY